MNPEIKAKFETYPNDAQQQLERVRELILTLAAYNELGGVEETLKWGEASYLVKGGTTIRIDWKRDQPEVIKVFFHCQTRLIETFKELHRYELEYEGNRAILIPLKVDIRQLPLGHCIETALKYHRLKHLPLLGG